MSFLVGPPFLELLSSCAGIPARPPLALARSPRCLVHYLHRVVPTSSVRGHREYLPPPPSVKLGRMDKVVETLCHGLTGPVTMNTLVVPLCHTLYSPKSSGPSRLPEHLDVLFTSPLKAPPPFLLPHRSCWHCGTARTKARASGRTSPACLRGAPFTLRVRIWTSPPLARPALCRHQSVLLFLLSVSDSPVQWQAGTAGQGLQCEGGHFDVRSMWAKLAPVGGLWLHSSRRNPFCHPRYGCYPREGSLTRDSTFGTPVDPTPMLSKFDVNAELVGGGNVRTCSLDANGVLLRQ